MSDEEKYIPLEARDMKVEKTFRERWYSLFSEQDTQNIVRQISIARTTVDMSTVVLFRITNVFINDRSPKKFRSYSVGFDEARYYINYSMFSSVETAVKSKERDIEPSEFDIFSSLPLLKVLKFSEKFQKGLEEGSDDSLCKNGLEGHEIEVDETKLSEEDFINISENDLDDFINILMQEVDKISEEINKRKVRVSLDLFARDFKKIIQLHNQLIS
ncbi:MAG: hypothetical protein ACD_71C00147G0001 [uncultured bacterium (gcode 4)]|uniref:Uncharacterized protein n=1 Tax=uncultured bacterium (gcode 4) TaxID=1234023 RepID=K2A301_9BACT|nr:MAG: hypothetical protein ACD_71C00147G0001 [uncultured bacterium (gcode 4)]